MKMFIQIFPIRMHLPHILFESCSLWLGYFLVNEKSKLQICNLERLNYHLLCSKLLSPIPFARFHPKQDALFMEYNRVELSWVQNIQCM